MYVHVHSIITEICTCICTAVPSPIQIKRPNRTTPDIAWHSYTSVDVKSGKSLHVWRILSYCRVYVVYMMCTVLHVAVCSNNMDIKMYVYNIYIYIHTLWRICRYINGLYSEESRLCGSSSKAYRFRIYKQCLNECADFSSCQQISPMKW